MTGLQLNGVEEVAAEARCSLTDLAKELICIDNEHTISFNVTNESRHVIYSATLCLIEKKVDVPLAAADEGACPR